MKRGHSPLIRWQRSADKAAAKAHCNSVGARACLQFGEQVADVRLDRLLREEEALADLAVHETVRDQLEHFDLAIRRLLLELTHRRGERDDVTVRAATPLSDLL